MRQLRVNSGRCTQRLVVALPCLLLFACATPEREEDPGPLYYPAPPEQPRFVHEFSLRKRTDIQLETAEQKLMNKLTGKTSDDEDLFVKPLDIAARGGRIYITDTLGKAVHAFDVARRRYWTFGVRFEGELGKPAGIDTDHQGLVYVADVQRRTVIVYDNLGLYQRKIGDAELLQRPTGVAVTPSGDRIYVIDAGGVESDQHRVRVFDRAGAHLFDIGQRGNANGEFNLPVDGAVGSDGTLYVLDAGNFRVQSFDRDGGFVRTWGSIGPGFGQFARPRHLAVDDQNQVYVSDAQFGNVQIFDTEGRLLLPVGRVGGKDRRGVFSLLAGIAVDETGRLYAVDQINKKVEVFRALGEGR